jgi:hypothetical protein
VKGMDGLLLFGRARNQRLHFCICLRQIEGANQCGNGPALIVAHPYIDGSSIPADRAFKVAVVERVLNVDVPGCIDRLGWSMTSCAPSTRESAAGHMRSLMGTPTIRYPLRLEVARLAVHVEAPRRSLS